MGGIGVAPIESEDDGFTARSAAAYGITSQMVGIFRMPPHEVALIPPARWHWCPPRHMAGQPQLYLIFVRFENLAGQPQPYMNRVRHLNLAGLERFELSMPEPNSGVLPITPQPIIHFWSVR